MYEDETAPGSMLMLMMVDADDGDDRSVGQIDNFGGHRMLQRIVTQHLLLRPQRVSDASVRMLQSSRIITWV